MADVLVGYSGGTPVYKTPSGQCYLYDETYGYISDVTCPKNTVPINTPNVPTIFSPNVSTGQYIPPGQSWFNDILNTLLGISAIGAGGTIQGGTINPKTPQVFQTPVYPSNPNNANNLGNAGANLGGSLQSFVTKNFTFIALGVGVYLLYQSGRKK